MRKPVFRKKGIAPDLTEEEFLLSLVVDVYNKQHGQKFDISYFELTSIRPRKGYQLGYQVETKRKDDHVKLRVYLNLRDFTQLHPFRPEVDQSYSPPLTLDDELLVAFGTIDRWYLQEGIFKFRPINNEEMLLEYLALEDGTALLLENGEVFELEE